MTAVFAAAASQARICNGMLDYDIDLRLFMINMTSTEARLLRDSECIGPQPVLVGFGEEAGVCVTLILQADRSEIARGSLFAAIPGSSTP